MNFFKRIGTATAIFTLFTGSAYANLVVNGSFTQLTNNVGQEITAVDNYIINDTANHAGWSGPAWNLQWGYNLTGWSNSNGVPILFGPGLADSATYLPLYSDELAAARGKAPGEYRQSNWTVYGPNNVDYRQVDNGLADTSPDGGNFFGADSNWLQGKLTQTINGLVAGQEYELGFWWAGAQLNTGGSGPNLTTGWKVTLGTDVNESVSGVVKTVTSARLPDQGYLPWAQEIFTFTASKTGSALLTFAAIGTGSPPMSLLDGISIEAVPPVTEVPEPSTWALMLGALAVLGMRLRRLRSSH